MEIAKGKIGNALTSTAKNHVVAVANDLYDEELNKYQSELNKQFIEGGGKADYFDGGIIDITKSM
jgi:hypothetical protein